MKKILISMPLIPLFVSLHGMTFETESFYQQHKTACWVGGSIASTVVVATVVAILYNLVKQAEKKPEIQSPTLPDNILPEDSDLSDNNGPLNNKKTDIDNLNVDSEKSSSSDDIPSQNKSNTSSSDNLNGSKNLNDLLENTSSNDDIRQQFNNDFSEKPILKDQPEDQKGPTEIQTENPTKDPKSKKDFTEPQPEDQTETQPKISTEPQPEDQTETQPKISTEPQPEVQTETQPEDQKKDPKPSTVRTQPRIEFPDDDVPSNAENNGSGQPKSNNAIEEAPLNLLQVSSGQQVQIEQGAYILTGQNIFEFCKHVRTCQSISLDLDIVLNVSEIPENMFLNLPIRKVTLGPDVQTVGKCSFDGIESLVEVDTSRCTQLTTIGQNAFRRTGIANINIPGSVTKIMSNAFEDCVNLKNVQFSGTFNPAAKQGANVFKGTSADLEITVHNDKNWTKKKMVPQFIGNKTAQIVKVD